MIWRCVALDFRGKRCGRFAPISIPVTFTWDPTTGAGVGVGGAVDPDLADREAATTRQRRGLR